MPTARRRSRILATLTEEDDAGQAAMDLFIERGGSPPPTHVSPERYERLVANDEGREALRVIAERLDWVAGEG